MQLNYSMYANRRIENVYDDDIIPKRGVYVDLMNFLNNSERQG